MSRDATGSFTLLQRPCAPFFNCFVALQIFGQTLDYYYPGTHKNLCIVMSACSSKRARELLAIADIAIQKQFICSSRYFTLTFNESQIRLDNNA